MSYRFKDDPFVCPECRKVGFCINRAKRRNQFIADFPVLEVRNIVNHVPVKTSIREAATNFGKKLQQAHDLFHQDEYEQASYLYADMITSRKDCNEIIIGLAASLYFLNKIEEAATIILNLPEWHDNRFRDKFIALCESKTISENEKLMSTEITKQKIASTLQV